MTEKLLLDGKDYIQYIKAIAKSKNIPLRKICEKANINIRSLQRWEQNICSPKIKDINVLYQATVDLMSI